MTDTITKLLDRFLSGSPLSREEVLYGILLIGFVIASLQMLVMLVTRWGDRNPTSKALFFSILVHLSTVFGVVAYQPTVDATLLAKEEADRPREVILKELKLQSETQIAAMEAGNTPVWEKAPAPDELQFDRKHELPLDPTPLTELDREPIQTQLAINTPDINRLPDWVPDEPNIPSLEEQDRPERVEDTQALPVDTPEKFTRSEPSQPRISPFRRKVDRPGDATSEVDRKAIAGSADRIFRTFDPAEQMASLSPEEKPEATIRRDDDPNRLSRAAPDLVPEVNDDAGLNTDDPGRGLGDNLPTRTKFTRRETDGANPIRRRPVRDREPARLSVPNRKTDGDLIASRTQDFGPPSDLPSPSIAKTAKDDRIREEDDSPSLPATYRNRKKETRLETARKNGGTTDTERAVEAALKWLASTQEADGRWDASKYQSGQIGVDSDGVNRRYAGRDADNGVTALATLAFLGAGYTHEDGKYQETVVKALRYLIKTQTVEGFIGGNATHYAKMYSHGMASYALAEAYGMSQPEGGKKWLRFPLQKAIAFILDQQGDDGGWRYVKAQEGDMSMFGWQLMALRSAELSGIDVPKEANTKMIRFLNNSGLGQHGGLAAYRGGQKVTAAMTAEALFCKQRFFLPRDHAASKEAVDYLMAHLPKRSELDLYYWYYGTLAMFQYGGDEWKRWNLAFRDTLVSEQVGSGPLAGSWNPTGPWGPYGGRIYSTSISTLSLEAYYRFLPLYRISDRNRND